MSLQVFQSKSLILALIFLVMLVPNSLFGSQSSTPRTEVVHKDHAADSTYDKIIRKERKIRSQDRVFEDTASGIAAVIIGFYGYYFDQRGIMAKVVYSATQTAGVYLISDATFRANQPNLVLDMDSRWKARNEFDYAEFRRMVVRNEDDLKIADYKKNAYAGALLAAIYLYDAAKEKEIKALSNIFYFVGLNFVLVSGASFYKALTYERTEISSENPRWPSMKVRISVLPLPQISLAF
jgi:hypothetical protein